MSTKPPNSTPEDDGEYYFTKRIRLRNGKVIYAHQYGLKAFRIPKRKKKDGGEDDQKN